LWLKSAILKYLSESTEATEALGKKKIIREGQKEEKFSSDFFFILKKLFF